MEENKTDLENKQNTSENLGQNSRNVSFPSVTSSKKQKGAKTLLIFGSLVLIGVLGFAIFKSATKESSVRIEPTPIEGLNNNNVFEPTPSPTPVPTPNSEIRSKISIEVQNGTGIVGEAAYLQTQLSNLGYSDVTTANAAETGTVTEVTFSNSVPESVVYELTQKLKSIYQNVNFKTSESLETDVLVITGLRRGSTPIPSSADNSVDSFEATPTPAQ